MPPLEIPESLAWAHPVTAEWFLTKFGTPTEPQTHGWPSILAGDATLISAPTGSGKTLAAFLVCIDQLLRAALSGQLTPHTQVVYVSPLKALSNDVQKNLDAPLAEIQQLAIARGYLCPEIRTAVRTGDTLPKERAAMLRNPPHILVTTPESLYILLTAGKSREHLRRVRTVIVDEIHAVADDKRGAHLALSLERLDALVTGENRLSPGQFLTGLATPPQRIGLSATQNPIELVADFLTGVHPEPQARHHHPGRPAPPARPRHRSPHRRTQLRHHHRHVGRDLRQTRRPRAEPPLHARLRQHPPPRRKDRLRTRRTASAPKTSPPTTARSPASSASTPSSASKTARSKSSSPPPRSNSASTSATSTSSARSAPPAPSPSPCSASAAPATGAEPSPKAASSPPPATTSWSRPPSSARCAPANSISSKFLRNPPTSSCSRSSPPAEPSPGKKTPSTTSSAAPTPTATSPAKPSTKSSPSSPKASSPPAAATAPICSATASSTISTRAAAPACIAISNGGAIPDVALYNVILQPEGVQIATLDEHFAVDSSPGDVVLLGNTSWRIQRIEAAGRVLVEDAHGAPPTLPFWFGEAPQRTAVLSDGVGELREQISARTPNVSPGYISPADPEVAATIAWLIEDCGVCDSGAHQLIAYIVTGRAVLGAVPSKTTIIAERFFDDGGGMQLILHAPFGGRINKALGLALRKRFCRGFNFELQAAATDNGINISLAEQHSFPLSDVFHFLTEHTAKELLEQASIASPIFKNRWRWAAGRSLQLLRISKGKRIAPQIQRTRSEDLMASVFPQAAACFETIVGDIQIPDHPLVNEVMQDVLQEAMDLEGLIELLRGIKDGSHPLPRRRHSHALRLRPRTPQRQPLRLPRRSRSRRTPRPRHSH